MDEKYEQLRAALGAANEFVVNCFVTVNSADIRALLADYDRMRVALTTIKEWPISSPLNMDAYNMQVVAHAALAQEQGGSDAQD